MLRNAILVLFCFLIAVHGFAQDSKPIVFESLSTSGIQPIKRGDPSPVDGYVITKDFEKNLREINERNKILKEKEVALRQLGELKDLKMEYYKRESNSLHATLSKERMKTYLYFIGGVLLTGLVTYGTLRAVGR